MTRVPVGRRRLGARARDGPAAARRRPARLDRRRTGRRTSWSSSRTVSRIPARGPVLVAGGIAAPRRRRARGRHGRRPVRRARRRPVPALPRPAPHRRGPVVADDRRAAARRRGRRRGRAGRRASAPVSAPRPCSRTSTASPASRRAPRSRWPCRTRCPADARGRCTPSAGAPPSRRRWSARRAGESRRQAAGAAFFRGRPRPRLVATTTPPTNTSPPHTPHGSARSMAPARHPSISGHSRHRALACSTSAVRSANQSSGSFDRHGMKSATSWSNVLAVVGRRSAVGDGPLAGSALVHRVEQRREPHDVLLMSLLVSVLRRCRTDCQPVHPTHREKQKGRGSEFGLRGLCLVRGQIMGVRIRYVRGSVAVRRFDPPIGSRAPPPMGRAIPWNRNVVGATDRGRNA